MLGAPTQQMLRERMRMEAATNPWLPSALNSAATSAALSFLVICLSPRLAAFSDASVSKHTHTNVRLVKTVN